MIVTYATDPSPKTSQSKPPKSVPLFVNVLSQRQRAILVGLISLWFVTLVWFWHWWLQPQHIVTLEGAIVCSLFLAWDTMMPAYYFFFVLQMQRANPQRQLPDHWRVAMVVTKAPSEPWEGVKNTLQAMIAQDYPHDNWLADENPASETLDWCRQNQVQVSTRAGVAAYHQPTWPRRTRCKEGNLAYFYDHYGYQNYDFVAQLDADHVPSPGYLEAMLRPFLNDQIGYVAAPSICDANADRSWVVKARLFAEATMHGSLQAGYNSGWAPLCIGSHYAVRTGALKAIGGIGPELAEDHTTTLMMNACGWRGAFALDAEAHGDGPSSFADFLVQEFQWARSLVVVLLSITPRYLGALPPHLKFQFLFSQLWYPIVAITMLMGSLMPVVALVLNRTWISVGYGEFLGRSFILTLTCLLPILLIQRAGVLRPNHAKLISWEIVLFQFARWPWILMAVGSAVIGCIRGRELPFKVTPKGNSTAKPLPLPLIVPYLGLALVSGAAVLCCRDADRAQGYYFLACLNMLIYSGLCLVVLQLHFRENVLKYRDYLPHYGLTGLAFGVLALASVTQFNRGVKAMVSYSPVVQSLVNQLNPQQLSQVTTKPASGRRSQASTQAQPTSAQGQPTAEQQPLRKP
jgi:cellulose synthase (UDP-forming)